LATIVNLCDARSALGMRSVLAELGIAISVGILMALQMAGEIVDGESMLDLPDVVNIVVVLGGHGCACRPHRRP